MTLPTPNRVPQAGFARFVVCFLFTILLVAGGIIFRNFLASALNSALHDNLASEWACAPQKLSPRDSSSIKLRQTA